MYTNPCPDGCDPELWEDANRKLKNYHGLLKAMALEELKAEWKKVHPDRLAPAHDLQRMRKEIMRTWEEIIGNLLATATTIEEIPSRPDEGRLQF